MYAAFVGHPPQETLHCPTEMLEQEAGDKDADFFRCRSSVDDRSGQTRTVGFNSTPTQLTLTQEAYSWGGLPSGSAGRALWLLLVAVRPDQSGALDAARVENRPRRGGPVR